MGDLGGLSVLVARGVVVPLLLVGDCGEADQCDDAGCEGVVGGREDVVADLRCKKKDGGWCRNREEEELCSVSESWTHVSVAFRAKGGGGRTFCNRLIKMTSNKKNQNGGMYSLSTSHL